jgi:membrane fusion protein (multidrug efflux system)
MKAKRMNAYSRHRRVALWVGGQTPGVQKARRLMKASPVLGIGLALVSLSLSGCERAAEAHTAEVEQNIVATSPLKKDIITTQQYVCQIHSRRHIEICALERGYLQQIEVKEGQKVEEGQSMFKIVPIIYQARLDSDLAEAELAKIEYVNTKSLYDQKVRGQSIVAKPEVAIAQAKLQRAEAQVKLARAELNFADIKAPFDGIMDRLMQQQGSLIEEGDVLTTLSDNEVMWVYFNVPEARYLEYMAAGEDEKASEVVELQLANGDKFPEPGKIAAIEAQFNNENGNIAFRADFSNPKHLLRHGQTGNILIHRKVNDAILIPQRAVFEVLDQLYVFVVDKDGTVRQREISVAGEQEDIFIIKSGLDVNDKFILEGVREVHNGQKLEKYEFQKPTEALSNLKYHAE